MAYKVRFVDDGQLPADVHWALIRDGMDFYYVAKASRVTPLLLSEGWAAYRCAIRVPSPRRGLVAVR